MQIGQIVVTLVPILHPSADDILVTGNPSRRIEAVLAKKEFVNMDLSIIEKSTLLLQGLISPSKTYQDAYMADYYPQVN